VPASQKVMNCSDPEPVNLLLYARLYSWPCHVFQTKKTHQKIRHQTPKQASDAVRYLQPGIGEGQCFLPRADLGKQNPPPGDAASRSAEAVKISGNICTAGHLNSRIELTGLP
jgi:hypothetical protein